MESQRLSELINPTERQREAFAATLTHQYVLYGGAASGGKSYWLRWWCVRELLRLFGSSGIRGLRIGLFSEDYPTLVDRQISKITYEFPDWLGIVKRTEKEGFNFRLHDKFGGGMIALRNLDDPSKYKSSEFAGIAVEELTHNSEEVFHALRFRLRWPGVEKPRFVAATNPGGIGHAWVKRFWIDRDFPEEMQSLADDFTFVQAKVSDNPHVPLEYRKTLESLPEKDRKAYLDGDWDIFAGQYFSEWRKEIHTCDPFTVPRWWKSWRCGDWGYENPSAYLWLAADPEGWIYVTDEVYGKHMRVEEQAGRILAIDELRQPDINYSPLDAACWDDSRGESIADQFWRQGVKWQKSGKDRIGGWQRLKTLLHFEENSQPRLKVFNTCKHLIRTLPALIHDEHRKEDVDTDGEDHAADALRYGLEHVEPVTVQPLRTMHPDDAMGYLNAIPRESKYVSQM